MFAVEMVEADSLIGQSGTRSPYKINVVLSNECAEFVGVIHESTYGRVTQGGGLLPPFAVKICWWNGSPRTSTPTI